MILRSLLFVPGDSEKKLARADSCPADALILDLEDSVAPGHKTLAREMVQDFLTARPQASRRSELWVRINPGTEPDALADLAAIVAARPDGIVLPKAEGTDDVRRLGHYLDALETTAAMTLSSTRILPVTTETARAPFHLQGYADIDLPRLAGITWGAEDLSAALGASSNLDSDGEWAFTYRMVRSMTLLAAAAASVPAIDTVYVDFRDSAGLEQSCQRARVEGFTGRLAIHPDQVEIINAGFMPASEEVDLALRIIAAFDESPDQGVVGIGGKMYDIPHLKRARQTVALHDRYGEQQP